MKPEACGYEFIILLQASITFFILAVAQVKATDVVVAYPAADLNFKVTVLVAISKPKKELTGSKAASGSQPTTPPLPAKLAPACVPPPVIPVSTVLSAKYK